LTCQKIFKEIEALPDKVGEILAKADSIKKIAAEYDDFNDFLYLGRKYSYPIALEGALKLKEISYVHAEGYAFGEMKHGPIAMICESFPTFVIMPKDSVYEKSFSNIEEIKARYGKVVGVITEGDEKGRKLLDDYFEVPKTMEVLYPILTTIVTQLFAYYIGVSKGYDVR